ncbi:hypothetical protein, partial [Stenotrophomonas maltophilia]|uniref:hypothetical protein n=1 Tax=Stenotrophomonas maltophilia TaxID=40324 RepID=UPI003CCFE910
YNAVQRLLYWLVLGLGALLVLSGLAIWKPVQLHGLTVLFGGFQGARHQQHQQQVHDDEPDAPGHGQEMHPARTLVPM